MRNAIIILIICMMVSCGQKSVTYDEGVVINGIKWASRNVDEFGTFAPTPESAGKFYQWNRRKAWNTIVDTLKGWDKSIPGGFFYWYRINDPSPKGWRVPTVDEITSLYDVEKVRSEWVTQNGINGTKFTDLATGNSIFLPALGFRSEYYGRLYEIEKGYYWTNDRSFGNLGVCLFFTYLDERNAKGMGIDANVYVTDRSPSLADALPIRPTAK
ncbi:MAG: fibrobacter succinogenes major paralogous domain-containing protein [Candidatus Azobacteroides sp.]|nr:fibrobacter succinogenes major paralogous domain-containing protein [Candidatus Azobacteroides sp.]